jgi:hypothetical protein
MRLSAICVALAALSAQATAQTDDPLRLAPSSKWVMDYDADSCSLKRMFGAAGQQALLELRAFSPGDSFDVTVASNTIGMTDKAPRVRFEPDTVFAEPSAKFGSLGDMEGVVFSGTLWPNLPQSAEDGEPRPPSTAEERNAREAEISALVVADSFERELRLETGPMHAPMEAMRACLDDLLLHWGIDAEAHRSLSRAVAPKDIQSWARELQEAYPRRMVRDAKSAYVRVRLIVGPDGRPASCHLQMQVPHPDFSETACNGLMRHARFEPALDAQGRAIASYYTTAIIYRIGP